MCTRHDKGDHANIPNQHVLKLIWQVYQSASHVRKISSHLRDAGVLIYLQIVTTFLLGIASVEVSSQIA